MLRLGAYVALSACVVGGLYYTGHRDDIQTHDSLVAGCHRGNVMREVVGHLLETAEAARRTPPIEPGDLAAANQYRHLGDLLEQAAVAGLDNHQPRDGVYSVPCADAYPSP